MEEFLAMLTKFLEVSGSGRSVSLSEMMPELDVYAIILLASLLIIIGVLQCFLGYKSFKVWCSFIGLILGAVLGLVFVSALGLYESEYAELISIFFVVCLAIVGAFLAYRAYLVGVFLYAFVSLFLMCYVPLSITLEPVMIAVIIGVCAGVAAGVVAVIIQRICIIAATCLSGALAIAFGLMTIFEGAGIFLAAVLPLIAALGCAGGGFFVQLATTKEKPKVQPAAQVAILPVQGVAYTQAPDGTAVPVVPVPVTPAAPPAQTAQPAAAAAPAAPAAPAAEAPAPAEAPASDATSADEPQK